jgi:putative transposase
VDALGKYALNGGFQMDEKQRLDLALFRFSLIAPLVNGSLEGSAQDYLETTCAKTYDVPGYGRRQFSPRTLLCWRSMYSQFGLDGLKVKNRKDLGGFRRLSADAQAFMIEAKRRQPKLTATALYEDLLAAKLLGNPPCSLSTVQRFLRTIEVPMSPVNEHRRFEFAHANDCWQSDACVGPHLLTNGRKQRIYLIAFLDDASRLVVHGRFYTSANSIDFEDAFRTALLKRGIPRKLYVDNGPFYRTLQLEMICARLGIVLSHSEPYRPEGRGKVERLFKTIRQQFFNRLTPEDVSSLDALNQAFAHYVEQVYHRRPHLALEGKSPMERFLQDKDLLRPVSEQQVAKAFLHEVKRRVRKDGTISLDNTVFEVPQCYVGQQIEVVFELGAPDNIRVRQPDGTLLPIAPVRPVDNSQIPRRRRVDPIDWRALTAETYTNRDQYTTGEGSVG